MPVIGFEEKDFLRGKIVAPAWYLVEVNEVTEKPSADGGSTNYPVEATIIKNATDGSTDYAGVPIYWNFNSKAKGFTLGFLQALGQDVTPGMRVELAGAVGHQLEVFVENKTYEGRLMNTVNHKYRKVGAGQ
jgi:hypothetical protein